MNRRSTFPRHIMDRPQRQARATKEACCDDQTGVGTCGLCQQPSRDMVAIIHQTADPDAVLLHCACAACDRLQPVHCPLCDLPRDSTFRVTCDRPSPLLDAALREVVVVDDDTEGAASAAPIVLSDDDDEEDDESLFLPSPIVILDDDEELQPASFSTARRFSPQPKRMRASLIEEDSDDDGGAGPAKLTAPGRRPASPPAPVPAARSLSPQRTDAGLGRRASQGLDRIIAAAGNDKRDPVLTYIGVYQKHASLLFHGQPAIPPGRLPDLARAGPGTKRHENRDLMCHARYKYKWCALIATKVKWHPQPPAGLRLTGTNAEAWESIGNNPPRGFCVGLLFLGDRRHMNNVQCSPRTREWVTGLYSHEVIFAVPFSRPFQYRAPQGDIKTAPDDLLRQVQQYLANPATGIAASEDVENGPDLGDATDDALEDAGLETEE